MWKKKLSHVPARVSRADATVRAHVCYSWVGGVFLQARVWSERVSSVCVFICVTGDECVFVMFMHVSVNVTWK